MKRPRRHLRLLERQWVWFLIAGGGGLALLAALVASALGLGPLSSSGPFIFRGYTKLGLLLGVLALALAALVGFYPLRKRALQESALPAQGSMAGWLALHVWLGILAGFAALLHAGYGAFSWQFSSGKLLLLAFLAVVASGVWWRLVYGWLPKRAAQRIGNYSIQQSQQRIEQLSIEIEKVSAGKSSQFQELTRWLAGARRRDADTAQALAALDPSERALGSELGALYRERWLESDNLRHKGRFTRWLQVWRVLHVPLSLLLVVLLPLHVVAALDMPALLVDEVGFGPTTQGLNLGAFAPASRCSQCHAAIVEQWRHSQHAHAADGALMIAQTNLFVRSSAKDAPHATRAVCVNCHSPIGTALTAGETLPLTANLPTFADAELVAEGVGCASCHQWQGQPSTGSGAHATFQAGLLPGRTFFGPRADAVGNAYHESRHSPIFDDSSALCRNCHNVQLDLNGDNKVAKGSDLVLQALYDEWLAYAKDGGASCVTCHMPVLDSTRSAEAALIPFEQDGPAPARALRDHSFVGTDYPLDLPVAQDRQRKARLGLLRSAASLHIDPSSVRVDAGRLRFDVTLENSGTGHDLPGGFAFVRQMWLEVLVKDRTGKIIGSSGALATPAADLCDASILADPTNPMKDFVEGCKEVDTQLVNFQQMLTSHTAPLRDASGRVVLDSRGSARLQRAETGRETLVQHLTGGAVARVRPADGKAQSPLAPRERRSLSYDFSVERTSELGTVETRLLFRTVPPYFLRAFAKEQAAGEVPLTTWLTNLRAEEMARVILTLDRR